MSSHLYFWQTWMSTITEMAGSTFASSWITIQDCVKDNPRPPNSVGTSIPIKPEIINKHVLKHNLLHSQTIVIVKLKHDYKPCWNKDSNTFGSNKPFWSIFETKGANFSAANSATNWSHQIHETWNIHSHILNNMHKAFIHQIIACFFIVIVFIKL